MDIFQDVRNALFGNPPTPDFKPDRALLLAAFGELITLVESYGVAIDNGMKLYVSKAEMDADTLQPDGTQGRIYTGPDAGIYLSIGGVWSIDTAYYAGIADVVQPLVDEAEAAATAAEAAAATIAAGDLFPLSRSDGVLTGSAGGFSAPGYLIGFGIAANTTANGTYVRSILPLTKDDILDLAGRTIRIFAITFASPNYEVLHPLVHDGVGILKSGVLSAAGTFVSMTQVGTQLIKVVDYTVVGDEDVITTQFKISSASSFNADANLTLSGLTYRVTTDTSTLGPSGRTLAALRIRNAGEPFGIGVDISEISFDGATFSDATFILNDNGQVVGIAVPNTKEGDNTYIFSRWTPSLEELAILGGAKVRLTMDFDTSNVWDLKIAAHLRYSTASTFTITPDEFVKVNELIRPNLYRIVIEGTMPIDLTTIVGSIQIDPGATGGAATANETIILKKWDVRILVPSGGYITPTTGGYAVTSADVNADVRALRGYKRTIRAAATDVMAKAKGYDVSLTIPNTSYGTLTAAVAHLNNTYSISRLRPVEINMSVGLYTDFNVDLPENIHVRGNNGQTTIQGAQANNTILSDITLKSGLNCSRSSRVSGLNVTMQNGRYAYHIDAQASPINARIVHEDCSFIHKGNDTATAYQISIGTPIGDGTYGVWGGMCGVGYGTNSGCEFVFRRCRIEGYKYTAMQGHNFANFASPSVLIIERCQLIAGNATDMYSFQYNALGSKQSDVIMFDDNILNAPLAASSWPFLLTASSEQIADKMGSIVWRGSGNTPVPYLWLDESSRALRIENTQTNKSLIITGTASDIVFGPQRYDREAVGLSSAAYGTYDIVSHTVTAPYSLSLGQRLGDCTAANKLLTITPQGVTPIVFTFNANYTAQSNATIIAAINAASGGAYTVSEMDVSERFRPVFTDEERLLRNTGSTVIKRKWAVAYDGDEFNCRVAINTDIALSFAGVAYEDIRPGEVGRVKTSGVIRQTQDMIRSDAGAFTLGTPFGVGATPGQFVANPTIPLIYAVSSKDVRVR